MIRKILAFIASFSLVFSALPAYAQGQEAPSADASVKAWAGDMIALLEKNDKRIEKALRAKFTINPSSLASIDMAGQEIDELEKQFQEKGDALSERFMLLNAVDAKYGAIQVLANQIIVIKHLIEFAKELRDVTTAIFHALPADAEISPRHLPHTFFVCETDAANELLAATKDATLAHLISECQNEFKNTRESIRRLVKQSEKQAPAPKSQSSGTGVDSGSQKSLAAEIDRLLTGENERRLSGLPLAGFSQAYSDSWLYMKLIEERETILKEHIQTLRRQSAPEAEILAYELEFGRADALLELIRWSYQMKSGPKEDFKEAFYATFVTGLAYLEFKLAYITVRAVTNCIKNALKRKKVETPKGKKPKNRPSKPSRKDLGIPDAPVVLGLGNDAEPGRCAMDLAIQSPEEKLEKAKQKERERIEQEEMQALERAQEEIEKSWDKEACWARAGNRFKGGGQDHSFYYFAAEALKEGRNAGRTRAEVIEEQWHLFKAKEDAHVLAKRRARANPAKVAAQAPREPVQAERPRSAPPPRRLGNPNDNDNNAPAPAEEIDWTVPTKPKTQSKKKGANKDKESPREERSAFVRAAHNEDLFLEGLLTWEREIERAHRLPIHDEIFADNIWYSMLLFYNGIAEYNAFGEHRPEGAESLFSANDDNARVLRNVVMHEFPHTDMLLQHYRHTTHPTVGTRIAAYLRGESVTDDTFLADLARTELFRHRFEGEMNINRLIQEQFEKIKKYRAYLDAKEDRLRAAFGLLQQQNAGRELFAGRMDYRLVDVFAAREIEAALVRLGKLYLLYRDQAGIFKTFPREVVDFLEMLNQKMRKVVAHNIDVENQEWHFSPVSGETVRELMNLAIEFGDAHLQQQRRLAYDPNAPVFQPKK